MPRAAILGLVMTSAAIAQPQVQIIARTGQPAPGMPNAALFTEVDRPVIANDGTIVFRGATNGPIGENTGLWRVAPNAAATLVVREGAFATALNRFGDFGAVRFPTPPTYSLSHTGHLSFVSLLLTPESRAVSVSAWTTRTGTPQLLGRNSQAVSPASVGTISSVQTPLSTTTGYTVFLSSLSRFSPPPTSLLRDTVGGIPREVLLTAAQQIPGGSRFYGSIQSAALNNSGTALVATFDNISSNSTNIPTLVRVGPNAVQEVLIDGVLFTNTLPGGGRFSSITDVALADDGSYAFTATRSTTPVPPEPDTYLFASRDGQTQVVLTRNQSIPGLRADEVVTQWSPVQLTTSGEIFTILDIRNTQTSLTRRVAAIYRRTNWVILAGAGDLAPGFAGGRFGDIRGTIASNGIVAITALVLNSTGGTIGEGTWITSPSRGLTLLMRDRLLVDVDEGPAEDFRLLRPSWFSSNELVCVEAAPINADGTMTVVLAEDNTPFFAIARITPQSQCDGIDFNRNGVFPENQDVIDFFTTLAGGPCPYVEPCDIDFNNNTVFPEDQDVIDFFATLAGDTCL